MPNKRQVLTFQPLVKLISLLSFKVENACYTLKVRGSEVPKHMLAGKLHTSSHHDHTNMHDTADTAAYDV